MNTNSTERNQPAFEDFVGRSGLPQQAGDRVNAPMIRHFCNALGDRNPVYVDEQAARDAGLDGIIAPPAMMQAWTMPDFGAVPNSSDAIAELYARLDSLGFVGIVATNSEQEYLKPLKIGDCVTSTKSITAISDLKTTQLGEGHFITSNVTFENQAGETVGTQLHRVLKYRPRVDQAASARPPEVTPPKSRPRPNITRDTAFYFQAAGQHRFVIQGCDQCHRLQHPPTAACRACGSLSLSPVAMSGRGKLFSYTVVHAPVDPPFKAPYNVILVELEEGPRVVSELVDTAPANIRIGMDVEVDFMDFPPDLGLPVFRRSRAAAGTAGDAKVGDRLQILSIPLSRSMIVATAIATRDFQFVHHDHEVARARGSADIFMNIITTQGLVARYATDWAGSSATLRKIQIRLGAQNYPSDTLTLSGAVAERRDSDAGAQFDLEVEGSNSRGTHVSGTVTIDVPSKGGMR